MSWRDTVKEEPKGSWRDTIKADDGRQEIPTPQAEKMPLGQVIRRGIEQGATANLGDEFAGGTEAVFQVFGVKGAGGPIEEMSFQKPNWFDADKFSNAYRTRRDSERADVNKARQDEPGVFLGTSLMGGVATAPLMPLGAVKSIGQAAKTGAAFGGLAGFGASEADTIGGMALDSGIGAGIGTVTGPAAYKAGQGLEWLGTTGRRGLGEYLKSPLKEGAEEIAAATERLGAKATPAMLRDSHILTKLESSLSQSPTPISRLVRGPMEKVFKAAEEVPDQVLADRTSLSPAQIGQMAQKGITGKIKGRADKAGEIFDRVRESTKHIPLDEKSAARVANNIVKMDDVTLAPGSSWATKAEQYAGWLKNAKNADQIKTLKTLVGRELEAARAKGGPEVEVLSSIQDRLSRFENNQTLRGARETMRGFAKSPTGKTGERLAAEGEVIGKGIVDELKQARTEWAGLMGDLRKLSGASRMGKINTPSVATSRIDAMRPEQVADRLYNPADSRLMNTMRELFPEEAGLMRQAQLADMARRSQDNLGRFQTNKFLNATKSLSPEAQEVLLGPGNIAKVNDLKTVYGAVKDLPRAAGPSGTPEGVDLLNMMNPYVWARDVARYGAYKGLQSDTTQRVADWLLKNPRMAKLAEESPKAFNAIVINLSERMATKAPMTPIPRVAGDELDQDSGTSARDPKK